MPTLPDRLRSDTPQLGLGVMYPAPGVIERIGPDWDWIWVDGQHGEFAYQDLLAAVRAGDLIQRPVVVRVPAHEPGSIGRALDMGAAGVMVPQVDTPQQAEAVVAAAKFPPLGNRSYGGRRPIDRADRAYSDTANQDALLIVQIESPTAVTNAAAIAAVPGVDALFLGPDDILLRRGVSMTAPRSRDTLAKEMGAVAAACRAQNKVAGTVGIGAEMLTFCASLGFQLIVAGADVSFLANSSQQAATAARAALKSSAARPSVPPSASSTPY